MILLRADSIEGQELDHAVPRLQIKYVELVDPRRDDEQWNLVDNSLCGSYWMSSISVARVALGIYNFLGDLSTAATTSVLLTLMPWRCALYGLRHLGLPSRLLLHCCCPNPTALIDQRPAKKDHDMQTRAAVAFPCCSRFAFSTALYRMGFLPFLLEAKGTSFPEIDFALALVFIGGAAGKFACGSLGARLGTANLTLPLIRR